MAKKSEKRGGAEVKKEGSGEVAGDLDLRRAHEAGEQRETSGASLCVFDVCFWRDGRCVDYVDSRGWRVTSGAQVVCVCCFCHFW